MAWDKATGKALGRAAAFLKRLQKLEPGQRIELPMTEFQDMEFPIDPAHRSTWEEKAVWLIRHCEFPCKCWENFENRDWVFEWAE